MPIRRPGLPLPLLALACAALLVLLAGCGGDGDSDTGPVPPPTAKAQRFPSAKGKTLRELTAATPSAPVLAPSVSVLNRGANRFGFALFDRSRKQVRGTAVALYTATLKGTGVRGPFTAREESLEVKPAFRSKTTALDPDAARSVYVADVPFNRTGKQIVLAMTMLDGRVVATDPVPVQVGVAVQPPKVGQRAVSIQTPTVAEAGGDLSTIDTRVPPLAALHEVDFADALGKRPIVLVFATPQLCASRVCGPVVDVAAQVQADYGRRAAFIHMEIYNGNRIDKGFRPQVGAWRLPTEPWTFVVDRMGRIAARFEGALSVGELERAVAKVVAR